MRHRFSSTARGATVVGAIVAIVVCGAAPPRASGAERATPPPSRQSIIDRIVAIVNAEVISLGQLQRAVELTRADQRGAFGGCLPYREPIAAAPTASGVEQGAGEPVGAPTSEPTVEPDEQQLRREVLECLIDGLLVFQHVRRFPQPGVTRFAVDEEYRRLVGEFPSREAFEAEMRRWGLRADEVRQDLERQLLIASYIDSRFRQFVDVSEEDVRSYYQDTLAAEMQRLGESLPPLQDVEATIREILAEREVNRRVDEFIADLRARGEITRYLW